MNVNTDIIIKSEKRVKLNIEIASVVLNAKPLKWFNIIQMFML